MPATMKRLSVKLVVAVPLHRDKYRQCNARRQTIYDEELTIDQNRVETKLTSEVVWPGQSRDNPEEKDTMKETQ
jgi:hypothetical protein